MSAQPPEEMARLFVEGATSLNWTEIPMNVQEAIMDGAAVFLDWRASVEVHDG